MTKYGSEEALRKYCPEIEGPSSSQARSDHLSGTSNGNAPIDDHSDTESTISDFSEDEAKDMEL